VAASGRLCLDRLAVEAAKKLLPAKNICYKSVSRNGWYDGFRYPAKFSLLATWYVAVVSSVGHSSSVTCLKAVFDITMQKGYRKQQGATGHFVANKAKALRME